MSNLREGAKSDLTFTLPRAYITAVRAAAQAKGLTSATALGRVVLLEHLRDMGLIDSYFRPIEAKESPDAVRNIEGIPV